jgi:glucose-1-phosphatase
MIKAIVTDLGGVIVRNDKSIIAMKLAEYSGMTPKEILGRFSSTVSTDFDKDFMLGMITAEDFFERCSKEFGLKGLSFEGFRKIYTEIYPINQDVVELLEDQSLSHKIILLSNTDSITHEHLSQKFPEAFNIFSAQVLSFKLHIAKPDQKIYLEAARIAGVMPEECVYIDDVKSYVLAAESVGMKAIHFINAGQLKEALAELN